jgi:hypothetical protein
MDIRKDSLETLALKSSVEEKCLGVIISIVGSWGMSAIKARNIDALRKGLKIL